MSQSSFLDEALLWSAEECKSNCSIALPKLIHYIKSSDDMQKKFDILKLLYTNFVPCIPQCQLEEACLLHIADKTAQLFDSLLEKIPLLLDNVQNISGATEEFQEGLATILTAAIDVLTCFEECLSYLGSNAENINLQHLKSLPAPVLLAVQSSYTHCRDSSHLYGDLLTLVSDQLTSLFRKTHSLQMNLISVIDKVQLDPGGSEDQIQVISAVLLGLFEISQLTTSLDVKISITMWKTISRWACQYKLQIQDRIQLDTMLTPLCTEMDSSLDYLMSQVPRKDTQPEISPSQAEEKAFCRGIKILGFQMKVLVTLVREFVDSLTFSIDSVIDFIFKVYRFSPPSLETRVYPQQYTAELAKHVTNGIPSLVCSLVPCRQLMYRLTSQKGVTEDCLLRLLLIIIVFDNLPNSSECVQNEWMCPSRLPEDESRMSVMTAMFVLFNHCHVELRLPVMLPGVMCKGKPHREVSLYEFVCTHSCAFVASLNDAHFSVLQEGLLEQLLSVSIFSPLLVIDIWNFVARYGTSELCRDQCLFVTRLLVKSGLNPSAQCCHLTMLTRNIFRFLAPQHQVEFVKIFPPESHLELYLVLPLSSLQPVTAQEVIEQLVTSCMKTMHGWINMSAPTGAHFTQTVISLECLSSIYSQPSLIEHHASPQLQSTVLTKLLHMWDSISNLNHQVWHDSSCLLQLPVSLLQCTSFMVQRFDNQQILQILTTSKQLLTSSSEEIRINLCECLGQLSTKTFTANSQQQQCLHLLSQCFTSLLSDTNPLVHHKALQVFCEFAENTPHESVVPESLESVPTVQDCVVNFLNKVPADAGSTLDVMQRLAAERDQLVQYCGSPAETIYKAAQYQPVIEAVEPLAKKQKLNMDQQACPNRGDPKCLSSCLLQLKSNISELEEICQLGGLPVQHHTELNAIIHRLQTVAKANR